MTVFDELPPSLKLYLQVEAMRQGMSYEVLLSEILAGRNPLPPHISELIRRVFKAKKRYEEAE